MKIEKIDTSEKTGYELKKKNVKQANKCVMR